jgi:hypothetical protein
MQWPIFGVTEPRYVTNEQEICCVESYKLRTQSAAARRKRGDEAAGPRLQRPVRRQLRHLAKLSTKLIRYRKPDWTSAKEPPMAPVSVQGRVSSSCTTDPEVRMTTDQRLPAVIWRPKGR